MLAAVRARAVDVVLVWKLDRLTRAYGPLAQLRDAFKPSDANVEASSEDIDSHTIDLHIWAAREERHRIVERTLMGRRGAARKGKVQGNKLRWGYRRGWDGRPEIHQPAAAEVLHCAIAYAAGVPIREITANLEARGVLTPQRGPHQVVEVDALSDHH